jgi:hypothetical protein
VKQGEKNKLKSLGYLPHMWALDQGQTQQGDWTLIARQKQEHTREI